METASTILERPRVKVMDVGEMFDHAIWHFVDNMGLYFRIMLYSVLPLGLLWGLAEDGLGLYFWLTAGEILPPGTAPTGDLLAVAIILVVLFFTLLYVFAMPFHAAAVIFATSSLYLGRRPTARDCARAALNVYPKVFVANLLLWVVLSIGFLLCFIPGVIMMFVFFCYYTVIVLENGPILGSLGRSAELMRGHKRKALAAYIVFMFLGWGAGFFEIIIPQGFGGAVLGGAAMALTLTFWPVINTAIYYSARSKVEHVDLDLRVNELDSGGEEAAHAPAL